MQAFISALQGPPGNDGTGVSIQGSYPTEAALLAAQPTGQVGEAWLVNGDLYVWSANTNSWDNVGSISGPKGDKGDAGASAYEIWLADPDNTGTVDDYLLSLVGDTGPKGDDGADGNPAVIVGTLSGQTTPLPGQNWMTNTDFEAGSTLGWVPLTPANSDLTTGAPGADGSDNSLICTQKTATAASVQSLSTAAPANLTNAFPVRGGTWVDFSTWAMLDRVTNSGNVACTVSVLVYNSAGTQVAVASTPGYSLNTPISGTTKQWAKVGHKYQIPNGIDAHFVRIRIQTAPLAIGDKFLIDRPVLLIGRAPEAGFVYIVGEPVPTAAADLGAVAGDGITFDGTGWSVTGPLRGPAGERGPTGEKGEQGDDGMDGESLVEVFSQAAEPTPTDGKELSFWIVP